MKFHPTRTFMSVAAVMTLALGAFVAGPPATAAIPLPTAAADSSLAKAITWVNPLKAGTYRFSSTHGPRCIPVIGGSTFHLGQDLGASNNAPIYAAASGKVSKLRSGTSNLSGYIVIDHNDNGRKIQTAYYHMWSAFTHVRLGQTVKAGQQIGRVGNSGPSTAPHLHFEVWDGAWYGGSAVEPVSWLKRRGVDMKADASLVYPNYTPAYCTYYAAKATALKSTPSSAASTLRTLSANAVLVSKPGTLTNGYVPVTSGGVTGWVERYAVSPRRLGTVVPVSSVIVPTITHKASQGVSFRTTAALNLRSRPQTGTILKTVPKAATVVGVGAATRDLAWMKVRSGSTTAWVSAKYLKRIVAAPVAVKTVASLRGQTFTIQTNLFLRKAAVTGSTMKMMSKGTKAVGTGKATLNGGWVQIKHGSMTGWASAAHLRKSTPKPAVKTATTAVNLRKGASTRHAVVATVRKGQRVSLTGGKSGTWVQVKYGTKSGWISAKYLR
ncbi:MAG: SH3 domain-containing protein [Arthrobacter sp.]|uniref:SH3 domain-containing protein n=1 Tax=Arthrobacter sp. TaxID=1667 RepID=UPI00348D61EA